MNEIIITLRQSDVLEGVREGKLLRDVGADLGLSKQYVSQVVRQLTDAGLLVLASRGRYVVTDEPQNYRKRPAVVSAVRFTGTPAADRIIRWAGSPSVRPVFGDKENPSVATALKIKTLEGTMRADLGDWIIRGTQGEFYPVKPAIFEALYEAVSEDGEG